MSKCNKCGTEVEKGDTFCPECGAKVVIPSEPKTITIWSVIKFFLIIGVMAFIINIFTKTGMNRGPGIILMFILLLLWSGILNWFLRKLFNMQISTGVKIVATIVILALVFASSATNRSSLPTQPYYYKEGKRALDQNELYSFVQNLNEILANRDYKTLKNLVDEGRIPEHVYENLAKIMDSGDVVSVKLDPKAQRVMEGMSEVDIAVYIYNNKGEQRRSGVTMFFENYGQGWRLKDIKPGLLDVKVDKSFIDSSQRGIESTKAIEQPKNIDYNIQPDKKIIIPDECGDIMGNVLHSVTDEDQCKMKCLNQCSSIGMERDKVVFS
ncbi:zinc ribbon domain-containing protein, partial [Candidatus Woesearchaeota archaeon]|nr:zinc ribbon domain-containing protein [Candidatus Woesearchaeota archaeon]